MNKPYRHTQIGYVMLVALGAGVLLLTGLMLVNGFAGVAWWFRFFWRCAWCCLRP